VAALYGLFYGPAAPSGAEWYTTAVDMGKASQFTVQNLTAGVSYAFAVQAYGDHGKVTLYAVLL
jgi:hypothetical protein